MSKNYFHISSHGLEKNDIFKSSEDFIQGMNDIALCKIGYDIRILAFCLMSNHFHFILYGTEHDCKAFSQEYKRRCAIRMRMRSGEVKGLKDVNIQINEINDKEYLENAIVYVLRNPIASSLRTMPYHYKWSSIDLYFNCAQKHSGKCLNEISERKRFRILKSCLPVPGNYLIDAAGMILPSCYVDHSAVEQIFSHPARLLLALARKIEADIEIKFGITKHIRMSDQEILTQMSSLIRNEFQKESISQLSMEQRIKLCKLLKRNFMASSKQIARLTRLDIDIIEKVI